MISYSRAYPQRGVHDRAEFTGNNRSAPGEVEAVRIAVDGSMCAVGLHPAPGRRVEQLRTLVGVPREVLASETGPVGLDVVRLDEDLDMWVDLDGAERHPLNPVASVVARAFGLHEQVWGPVVFTGDVDPADPDGLTRDVPVAAAVLLAGTAASCAIGPDQIARRRAEWARLDLTVTDTATTGDTDAGGVGETFDALAHTITTDGDLPRCAECGDYGSHPEHQPETLADQDPHDADAGPVLSGLVGSTTR